MKKTYTTPVVLVNGNVARETKNGTPDIVEDGTLAFPGAGSVGFYL